MDTRKHSTTYKANFHSGVLQQYAQRIRLLCARLARTTASKLVMNGQAAAAAASRKFCERNWRMVANVCVKRGVGLDEFAHLHYLATVSSAWFHRVDIKMLDFG